MPFQERETPQWNTGNLKFSKLIENPRIQPSGSQSRCLCLCFQSRALPLRVPGWWGPAGDKAPSPIFPSCLIGQDSAAGIQPLGLCWNKWLRIQRGNENGANLRKNLQTITVIQRFFRGWRWSDGGHVITLFIHSMNIEYPLCNTHCFLAAGDPSSSLQSRLKILVFVECMF